MSIQVISHSDYSVSIQDELNAANVAILQALKAAGVQFVRYLVIDPYNNSRAKVVPLKRLLALASTGKATLKNQVSIAEVSCAGLPNHGDIIVPGTLLDARRVLAILPDLSTLRVLPYCGKTAVVLGTLHDPTRSNELSPLCARGLLARVLDTARKDHGIVFQVGAEIEFILVHDEGELPEKQLPKPVDSSVFANATTLTDQEEFIADLCLQLEKQDIGVELIHAESAAGQLELVLPYETDVMRLADNVVLTRDTIRSVARAHNMRALFLPKVDPMQAGNGLHVHLSFRDLSSLTPNENAFPHREEVGRMSEKGESCLEGILNHLPGLMALTLPTSNSYRRVGKGCWTGNTISWATEDKESPLRVCLDLETGVATNLEMKLSDSTANIYLELAALLSAALDGMVRNLKLRPSISEDDPGLPANLGESLERLLQDSFLCAVLGKQLTTSYVTVRQAELEFAAQIEECEEVIIAYKKA